MIITLKEYLIAEGRSGSYPPDEPE